MYKELDDLELARCCRACDRQAMGELYTRYAAMIYTLCRRYVRDDEEARDLMHETFLAAFDKIETYSGKGALSGWLARIAVNRAINYLKRAHWKIISLGEWAVNEVAEPTKEDVNAVSQEKLLDFISQLPDLRRTVFNLYCIDGYSHREIGQMLGISEKGSAGVLSKARRQLQELIKRYLKEKEQ
ncbi:MAG: sigma-70 family RNA polymerase sigma factor [Bacteroidales bacterium]|nr:sigma-70 family RNA polymerase sigma factor [Bacteroidales bacterium]